MNSSPSLSAGLSRDYPSSSVSLPEVEAGLVLPSIHRNGTGAETLQRDYDKAAETLVDFVNAWQAIEFNARDYYTQGAGAWEKARDEREAMAGKIREVSKYLEAIREHLYA